MFISSPENAAEFLASSLASGSKLPAAPFGLNYDQESPIRQIDVGGPDQEQRYVLGSKADYGYLTLLIKAG